MSSWAVMYLSKWGPWAASDLKDWVEIISKKREYKGFSDPQVWEEIALVAKEVLDENAHK